MAQTIEVFTTLLEAVDLLPETKHISVVAISGFGGSGKTTLARKLAESLPNAAVVPADDFMKSNYRERSSDWGCIDRSRIIQEVLQPAEKGHEIIYHVFDWATEKATTTRSVATPRVLLLEGIGLIHPDLLPYFDFSIWIEADIKESAERGMTRDKEQLHTNNDRLWQEIWMPNDLDFFNQFYPHQKVDCIYKPRD